MQLVGSQSLQTFYFLWIHVRHHFPQNFYIYFLPSFFSHVLPSEYCTTANFPLHLQSFSPNTSTSSLSFPSASPTHTSALLVLMLTNGANSPLITGPIASRNGVVLSHRQS